MIYRLTLTVYGLNVQTPNWATQRKWNHKVVSPISLLKWLIATIGQHSHYHRHGKNKRTRVYLWTKVSWIEIRKMLQLERLHCSRVWILNCTVGFGLAVLSFHVSICVPYSGLKSCEQTFSWIAFVPTSENGTRPNAYSLPSELSRAVTTMFE